MESTNTLGMGFMGAGTVGAGALGMGFVPITKDTFIPGEEDIFIHSGKEKQRLIFGEPLEFEEEENLKLQEFLSYITDNNLEIPEGYDHRELYRFYQGCAYNAKKAYEGILDNHQFLKDNLPVDVSGIEHILQSGMVYFCKRDIHYRPVLVVNVKKAVAMEFEGDDLTKITLAMVHYVTSKLPDLNYRQWNETRSG